MNHFPQSFKTGQKKEYMSKEISFSDIPNYMGRKLTFEEISTGKQVFIHFYKNDGKRLYGTSVRKNEKIYHEMAIGYSDKETKIYVNE